MNFQQKINYIENSIHAPVLSISVYCNKYYGSTIEENSLISSEQKTNSVALSQQGNYTDRATATCQRNLVPTFADRGVSRGQCGESPRAVNLSFLERSRYFSFKYLLIYPHKG
jgi:hypothetical protein